MSSLIVDDSSDQNVNAAVFTTPHPTPSQDSQQNQYEYIQQQQIQSTTISKSWMNDGLTVATLIAIIACLLSFDVTPRVWNTAAIMETLTHFPKLVWQEYSAVLSEHPIATKACTSATVYTIGDIIAQRTTGNVDELDRIRIIRSMLAGLVGHGPLSHCWYNICDCFFTNTLHLTAWWAFIPKVIVDQTLWGPIWNNTYLLLIGLMKLERIDVIWDDIKKSTIPMVVSGLKLWPAAHVVTYGLIPVENRLLWVDVVEIIWVTILSKQAASLDKSDDDKSVALLPETYR
jgi:protein Mpv17